VLAVHTGLSKGELLALKWDNVNLEVGMLQAWRTLVKTNGGPVLAAPKTRSSRRSVN
jgi:integrase